MSAAARLPIRHRLRITAVALLLLVPVTLVAAQDLVDKGTFMIYQQGHRIGQESFDISLVNGAGKVTSHTRYKINRDNGPVDITLESTLVLDPHLVPRSYQLTSEVNHTRQGLKVDFKPRLAVCDFDYGSEKKTQAAIVPAGATVIDENVFSHWAMLLTRYDQKKKGPQSFTVFVPQMGKEGVGQVTIDLVGREKVELATRSIKANHFSIRSSNLVLDAWQDSMGRVVKITSPKNQAEVIRAN